MKTIKKSIVLIITIILSFISVADAQTDDNQQRQRDIKIAEGILTEIFDGGSSSENTYFSGFRSQHVRGEYIPGYGVHFTVSPGFSNFIHIRDFRSDDEEVRVGISRNGSSSKTASDTEEEIRDKVYEYMKTYASLIRGLSDDETVRVTYTPNQRGAATWVFVGDSELTVEPQSGISFWARVDDLKKFRNGSISEQELMDRIQTHELNSDESYKDFNVFASVLETALNSVETEYLRVNRKPQMEYLPGLGVRYRIQVSTKPSIILDDIHFLDGDFEFRMDSLRINLDESLRLMEESLNPLILKLDSVLDFDMSEEEREKIRQELQEQRRVIQIHQDSLQNSLRPLAAPSPPARASNVDLQPEADAIMEELFSIIENYGSTLTSLENEEMLMISVNWSGRSDDLPERTEVRIKKSDLLRGEKPDIEEIERR